MKRLRPGPLPAAALLCGLVGCGVSEPRSLRHAADLQYWFLDIYDDFFSREAAASGTGYYAARRPFSRPSRFPAVKAPDAFRVFIVGGSVAYELARRPPPGAERRTLEDALLTVLPGRAVEVINCGMVSYDSYRESLILKEVLRHSPDLVILMSGNNESLPGAGPPSQRLVLALRARRWLRFLGLKPPAPASPVPIPPGQALASFERNLRSMAQAARDAGAIFMPCTLPRRLDAVPSPWPYAQRDFFRTWLSAEEAGGAAALNLWKRYLSLHPGDAYARFCLARALADRGDTRAARREYRTARDGLPDARNPAVRRVSRELGLPLCDLEAVFDGFPDAAQGGRVFLDRTHWYSFADPAVSHAIIRALERSRGKAAPPLAASWLAGAGAAWAVPKADDTELKRDYTRKFVWAFWESAGAAPQLSEQTLLSLSDLRRLDPARFARLTQLKPVFRKAVFENVWTKESSGEADRRWAWGVAHVGEVHRRSGQPRIALGFFDEALRLDAALAPVKLQKALALRRLGRKTEAETLIRSLSGLEPGMPEIRYVQELWGLRSRQAGDAVRTGLRNDAERLEAAGRPAEALALLGPALRREPPDEDLLCLALRIALSARDRAAIRELLTRAVKMDLSPEHSAFVAVVMRDLGRPEEALAVLGRALLRAPRSARLLNDKAVLEAGLGRLREAAAALEAAVAADPDKGTAYLSLGAVRSGLGEKALAEDAYTAALSRSRIRGDARLRGKLEDALRQLRRERQGSGR